MMSQWQWWLGGRWKMESAALLVFVAAVVYRVGGYGSLDLPWVAWWFVAPQWLPNSLEFEHAGGWSPQQRPLVPTGRVALAGPAWALIGAGFLCCNFDLVTASIPADGTDRWFVGTVVFLVLLLMFGSIVAAPRATNWIRQFNEEQRARTMKAERALSTARTQMLHAQMQPHFLFNALNTVSALLREDPARGRDVLQKLRGLLERSWRMPDRPFTTVADEVAFVRDQLAIEQERFRDRLSVDFDISAEALACEVPAFSLQPLVENALRHGIARSIGGGHIAISVQCEQSLLVMTVSDSVGGLDPQWKEGTGLQNLRDRLKVTYGSTATLDIWDDAGITRARVSLPSSPSPHLLSSSAPHLPTSPPPHLPSSPAPQLPSY